MIRSRIVVDFPNERKSGLTLCLLNKIIAFYHETSGSEITPCNKINIPLVVYRLTGNGKRYDVHNNIFVFLLFDSLRPINNLSGADLSGLNQY